MIAKSRDEVFATLRTQGIRPIKVVAADGSKANGEIRGVRKRIVATSILITAAIVGVIVFRMGKRVAENEFKIIQTPSGEIRLLSALPLPRQQILGERKRIEQIDDLLQNKADQFLARFAEPGREYFAPESEWPTKADFDEAQKDGLFYRENDFTERIDLARIVAGIRRELFEYLRGGGLVSGYIRELIKRQDKEISYRKTAAAQLEKLNPQQPGKNGDINKLGAAYEYWLKANAQLQSLGIYPLPLPDWLRSYQLVNTPEFP